MLKKEFEKKLERRMKNWQQEQHEKKVFGDPETEEVVWHIVPLPEGGFIRKPFKKAYLDSLNFDPIITYDESDSAGKLS